MHREPDMMGHHALGAGACVVLSAGAIWRAWDTGHYTVLTGILWSPSLHRAVLLRAQEEGIA